MAEIKTENLELSLIRQEGKKGKPEFYVEVPTKKGTAKMRIQDGMIRFKEKDAKDGMPVLVERAGGQIKKVVLKGYEEVDPPPAPPKTHAAHQNYAKGNRGYGTQKKAFSDSPAPASNIGMPFHNPYTFIPFEGRPERNAPTLRTKDEVEKERLSGVLEMEIVTERPLMTIHSNFKETNSTPELKVLKINQDVIVPSTAVRGHLRNLMTILTSGTLGNLDPELYVCRGRDVQLGPSDKDSSVPEKVFIAKVISPGNANRSGKIQVGRALCRNDMPLRKDFEGIWRNLESLKSPIHVAMVDTNGRKRPEKFNEAKHKGKIKWEVKISGRPIKQKGKREGIFAPDPTIPELTIPPALWKAYSARNVHGTRTELRKGDLVWLQAKDPQRGIRAEEDILSFQWARWGKQGKSFAEMVPGDYLPDYVNKDLKVDMVSDLFGQVPNDGSKDIPSLEGRIRPENLVFRDAAAEIMHDVELAPMSAPHPGCSTFYQKGGEFRGYKVYRTAKEGDKAWEYSTQPIFNGSKMKSFNQQKVARKADLLKPFQKGALRIAFQGLSEQELAVLVAACSCKWRLGGGKPLGLGLCKTNIRKILIMDDAGEISERNPDSCVIHGPLAAKVEKQRRYWEASQNPVEKMRYPRAAKTTNSNVQRGGHQWFGTFSVLKKNANQSNKFQTLAISESLRQKLQITEKSIDGQILPDFDPKNWNADLLYGYDCEIKTEKIGHTQNEHQSFAPFSEENHQTPKYPGLYSNNSQNRETRQQNKEERSKQE